MQTNARSAVEAWLVMSQGALQRLKSVALATFVQKGQRRRHHLVFVRITIKTLKRAISLKDRVAAPILMPPGMEHCA